MPNHITAESSCYFYKPLAVAWYIVEDVVYMVIHKDERCSDNLVSYQLISWFVWLYVVRNY